MAGDDEQETQSLLFSYHSGGAARGDLRDTPPSTRNVQQSSLFKIDKAKHKVFLSHSGAQKDFVEQLCVDLEASGHMFPFFDQRHHSLPKGKDFVPFIKEAAQRCHVAAVVLSEKFLCSKWPMIELAEFHAAKQAGNQQLNMLPLFYKLGVHDLDDRAIEDRWIPRWRQLAEADRRIDVEKWGAAVRALRKANGLVFGKHSTTEVGYRKEIVQSIFQLSPPDLLYGSSREMVGYDRMCEGLELLRKHVRREPVFLAIDNVTGDESSLREAREYLEVDFHPKSRILITSRSEANVHDLLPGSQFCMAMPGLRVKEAAEIFLKSAAPMKSISGLTDEEQRIVGLCIQQCLVVAEDHRDFCEPDVEEKQLLIDCDMWESRRSYHPLALSALGDFFRRYSSNTHMLHWKDHLEKNVDPFKDVWSSPDGIGRIIGLQFSSLHPSEQLLFLDVALYWKFLAAYIELHNNNQRSRWLERVSKLLDVTAAVMERKLRDLTRSGMINYDGARFDFNSSYFSVPVPTLYKEFAEWYATEHGLKGLRKNSWGVCQLSGAAQNRDSSLSDLVRLRVFDLSRASARLVASKTMEELRNLEVLQLHSCPNLTELNLQGLDSLRYLELVKLEKLVTVTLSGSSGADEDLGIYESLQCVALRDLESLTHGPELRSCRSVHWLSVWGCRKWTNLEQISECRDLKHLELGELVPQQWASIPIVESLPSLRYFYLWIEGDVDLRGVVDAVAGLECWDEALMLAELLRHLRSVRVDDIHMFNGALCIEWNRSGCDKLEVNEYRGSERTWGIFLQIGIILQM